MFLSNQKKSIAVITIFSFLMTLLLLPTNGYAKWHSNPPDEGISTSTLVLIGVGTALVVYLILKSSHKDKNSDSKSEENNIQNNEAQPDSLNSSSGGEESNAIFKLKGAGQLVSSQRSNFSLSPILEVINKPQLDAVSVNPSCNLEFNVGVSLNF